MLRRFRMDVAQAALDDLASRLARVRFAPSLPERAGEDLGVPQARVEALVDRWRHGYDWRAWEARLNRHPQFTARIDGVDVHFLHVRSPEPGALPLVLTHGWPMSVAEYLDVIGPLSDPRGHGGDPADAFHLVVPSLPGFGVSGQPQEPGWGPQRIAAAWTQLMDLLGYERYGAHGNDVGGVVSLELGRCSPAHVAGVHVTQVFSLPSGAPGELDDLSPEDTARLQRAQRFIADKGAYLRLHATQPRTLAHALADSPVAQLAWSLQLFGEDVSDDYVLTNATIHWLGNAAGSAALAAYYEPAHQPAPPSPTSVPLGVATFDDDVFPSVRRFAARDHPNLVSWNTYETGGHHPAHTTPAVLVADIRSFFRHLGTGRPLDSP